MVSEEHHYADPENQYVFSYVGSATYGAVNYNTKLVDVKDFKSYWDLLNPKWKGKIISRDVRVPGPGSGNARLFYYLPDVGPSFIRKLYGEMDVTLFRDYRQGTDWLAVGKVAICFFCEVDVFKQQGLPVDTFGPGFSRKAPAWCSNSARSRWLTARPIPTRRRSSSIGCCRAEVRWPAKKHAQNRESRRFVAHRYSQGRCAGAAAPRRGVKYLDTSRPEWQEMKPIFDVMNEALKAAGKIRT